jgi:FMN phosphatase YigB (HAD superfamily)
MTRLRRLANRLEGFLRRVGSEAWAELRDLRRPRAKKTSALGHARPLPPGIRTPTRTANDLRIAVQVHVFYPNLAAELLDACLNVPGQVTILVSAVTQEGAEAAKAWARARKFERLQVRIAPNRGRDVSGFTTTFGRDLLAGYDLFCHLHTKKSLYTGSEQNGWRRHNVDRLLGTRRQAKYVVDLFVRHPEIGLVAPAPYPSIPYWAFTWLSNRSSGEQLVQKLGLSTTWHGYIDYPLGCMFWARPEALAQLLDGRISYDDFPPEKGQTDGTLAHAVERVLALLARANGYHWIEVSTARDSAWLDSGDKNLWQYRERVKYGTLIGAIDRAKVVSFDVFDTLLTRITPDPDDVFRLVEARLDASSGRPTQFAALRKDAEHRLRRRSTRDVSCDQIYAEMSRTDLPSELVAEARAVEMAVEMSVLRPRERMMDAFRHAVRTGKRVVLTSDIYLTRERLESLLHAKGVRGYHELYVSSDVGVRKDTGAMWEHLTKAEDAKSDGFLHVGDNEHSDVQLPVDRGIKTFHVLSPRNLFALGALAGSLAPRLEREPTVPASLGPVIATLFNDPFEGR